MKSDLIFFSTDGRGLTSTSANHVANLAKEKVRLIEAELSLMVFYSTKVSLIGSDATNLLTPGVGSEELSEILPKLRTIAKAHSLIAWLREAIKAKTRLRDEVNEMSLDKYCRMRGVTKPEYPAYTEPLSDDDFYAAMSVDERNRYFEAEALASVLGKAVHQGGFVADARESLIGAIKVPSTIEGEGQNAIIYSYSPNVDAEDVDIVYFNIQKLFREAQAKVNAVKHECEEAKATSIHQVNRAYEEKLAAYNAGIELLTAEMNTYKNKKMHEISNYRIVIPPSLEGIYEEVNRLGKV